MRGGWEIKKLGEICSFENGDRGKNYPSRAKFVSEGWCFVNAGHLEDKTIQMHGMNYICKETYNLLGGGKFSEGDLLFCLRGSLGKFAIVKENQRGAIASSLIIVRPKQNVLNQYVGYFFNSELCQTMIKKYAGGAAQPNLAGKDLMKFEIPIPPIQEQHQIVAILDQAFEAIDQAKANIEKNIANTKELFQSKLNNIFSQKSDGWKEKKFSELFKLKSGDGLTAKNMCEGLYPVYGGNGIAGYHNNFNKNGKYLIIGRVGALCGNVRFLDEKFWLTDNAFQISEMKVDFDYRFLTYLLNAKDLRSHARQAAQPVISNSSLKDVLISYPSNTTIQKEYSDTLTLLEHKIEEIENSYKMKILELNDLKKSILQKAFAGELTNTAVLQQVAEPEARYSKK